MKVVINAVHLLYAPFPVRTRLYCVRGLAVLSLRWGPHQQQPVAAQMGFDAYKSLCPGQGSFSASRPISQIKFLGSYEFPTVGSSS